MTMRTIGYILTWAFAAIAVLAQPTSGVRVVELPLPPEGKAGFTLLRPDQTGVTFTNWLDEWASANNRVLNNGSGVAACDFDNDGWVDLFFCSLDQRNRLFKNPGHH